MELYWYLYIGTRYTSFIGTRRLQMVLLPVEPWLHSWNDEFQELLSIWFTLLKSQNSGRETINQA